VRANKTGKSNLKRALLQSIFTIAGNSEMTNNTNIGDAPQYIDETIQSALRSLQYQMAILDLLSNSSGSGQGMQLLLKEQKLIKLRMDANLNHSRAHIHIDYHRTPRIASYAINDGTLLAGDKSYNKVVQPWIARHKDKLMIIWEDLRGKGVDDAIVAELKNTPL
jgi:hypothetical protein